MEMFLTLRKESKIAAMNYLCKLYLDELFLFHDVKVTIVIFPISNFSLQINNQEILTSNSKCFTIHKR